MTSPSAIVVGDGLAGMVVARELALRRWRVTLLERSPRLGGKAGADRKRERLVEHGYHVFPQWYPNVRAIVNRLGVRLIDFDRYHFLLPGSYPRKSLCVGRQAWPRCGTIRFMDSCPGIITFCSSTPCWI